MGRLSRCKKLQKNSERFFFREFSKDGTSLLVSLVVRNNYIKFVPLHFE